MTLRLQTHEVEDWPHLTWVARTREGTLRTRLFHGPTVEVGRDWAIEGAWSGDYVQGGFDRTSLVFGSGVRCRDECTTFVSAGSNVDRLWYIRDGRERFVSNSLPALLAATRTRLFDSVPNYPAQVGSLRTKAGIGRVEIFSKSGPIQCVYHYNIRWDGRKMTLAQKPFDSPRFDSFTTYRNYLLESVRGVVENATSSARNRPMSMLTTVTRGYDSTAVSVLASEAGCERAATIRSGRSVVPRSDSGTEIAEHLGLTCTEYPLGGRDDSEELAFWAATGTVADANLSVFDYGEPPCLFFSGVHGGNIWSRDINDFHSGNLNALGMCEFRLREGVVHFPVPCCGVRRNWEVYEMSNASSMSPWSVDGSYDRPVPRRIVEEAGVPRESFGMQKTATMHDESFLWPRDPELHRSYARYIRERGESVPPVRLGRLLDKLEQYFLYPVRTRLLSSASPARFWRSSSRLLFQWANHELAEELRGSWSAKSRTRC